MRQLRALVFAAVGEPSDVIRYDRWSEVSSVLTQLRGAPQDINIPELVELSEVAAAADGWGGMRRQFFSTILLHPGGPETLRGYVADSSAPNAVRCAAIYALSERPSLVPVSIVVDAARQVGGFEALFASGEFFAVQRYEASALACSNDHERVGIIFEAVVATAPIFSLAKEYAENDVCAPSVIRWARTQLQSFDSNFVGARLASFEPGWSSRASNPAIHKSNCRDSQEQVARTCLDATAQATWLAIVGPAPFLDDPGP